MEGISLKFAQALPPLTVPAPTSPGPQQIEPDHMQQNKDSLEMDELRTKEDQTAMLILEDPSEFERQLAAGELEEMIDESADADE